MRLWIRSLVRGVAGTISSQRIYQVYFPATLPRWQCLVDALWDEKRTGTGVGISVA